jgi:hypothetical protein
MYAYMFIQIVDASKHVREKTVMLKQRRAVETSINEILPV